MFIRLAHQGDLPAINSIYNQAVHQGFCTAHLSPVSLEYSEAWFSVHEPDRFPVFVSVTDKNVTGWISLGAYRSDRQALLHVAEVSYYVDLHEIGKGIGTALMEHALLVSRSYNFTVLIAVLLSRNPASIALLEKFGFARWGSMPGIAKIRNQWADHLYYGLKL